MEENANFHCIVCKAEFLSRSERNEHLETHFIHRNCEVCTKPVIVIGDLEFELHQPSHCKQIETIYEDVFEGGDFIDDENHVDHSCEIEEQKEDLEEIDTESPRRTKRTKSKVDYTDEASESEHLRIVKNERPVRKTKRKTIKRNMKMEQIDEDNRFESNLDEEYVDIEYRKVDTDSDDEVVKEIDVALKKPRKQYTKLPKTVPCTKCDAMFGTERTLKIHMHQVHGIKERHICPICSREFKIGGNLKQHIETHSDYKRFICNYCGKGFHLPYNLKEHMNTHTGHR